MPKKEAPEFASDASQTKKVIIEMAVLDCIPTSPTLATESSLSEQLRNASHDLYSRLGIPAIPIAIDKTPNRKFSWEDYQGGFTDESVIDLLPWVGASGLGLINGPNHLRTIDIDAGTDSDGNKIPVPQELVRELLKMLHLPDDYVWALPSQSGFGVHVYFYCDIPGIALTGKNEPPKNRYVGYSRDGSFKQIELRIHDCYSILGSLPTEAMLESEIQTVKLAYLVPVLKEVAYFPPIHGSRNGSIGNSLNPDFPGGDFNQRCTGGELESLLTKHGWTIHEKAENYIDFIRPGHSSNRLDARLFTDTKVFYVFSPNAAPFKADAAYAPFPLYTLLEHGGDFSAAARELRNAGFGKEPDSRLLEGGHTEVDYKNRFVLLYGEQVRFVTKIGKFIVWDGKRWAFDDSSEHEQIQFMVETMLSETAEAAFALPESKVETRERTIADGSGNPITTTAYEVVQPQRDFLKEVSAKKTHRAIKAITNLVRNEREIRVRPNQLDQNRNLLNLQNGTFDLDSRKLRDHDSADLITAIANVEFDPDAEAPEFVKFLQAVLVNRGREPDADLVSYVQRALGYSLTPDMSEQVMFIAYGNGANGKSTLFNTVRKLLGDYGKATNFSTFDADNRNQYGNDIAALKESRFVFAGESESERRLAEARVKAVTGGDALTCRFLYGEFFEYQPQFKVWLAVNHKPTIRNTDHGIWRRIRFIPFYQKFEGESRVTTMEKTLEGEYSGILNWLLEGYRQWSEGALGSSEAVEEESQNYREESDTLGQWINERFEFDADSDAKTEIRTSYLFSDYKDWLYSQAETKFVPSMKSFATAIGEREGLHRDMGTKNPNKKISVVRGLKPSIDSETRTQAEKLSGLGWSEGKNGWEYVSPRAP